MKKIIHIHAKCKSFEIFENVDEDKSIRRLKTIRDMFNSTGTFYFKGKKEFGKFRWSDGDKLVVNTIVVNPEFNFKYQD